MKYSKRFNIFDKTKLSFWLDTDGFYEKVKMDEDEIKAYNWIGIVSRKWNGSSMISFVIYPFAINIFRKKDNG